MIVSSPSHQAYLSACVSVSAAERRWPLKPPWCPPRLFSPSDLEVLLDLTDFHSHTRTAGERATSGRRKKKKTTTLEASQEEKKIKAPVQTSLLYPPRVSGLFARARGVGVKHACLWWVLNFDAHPSQPPLLLLLLGLCPATATLCRWSTEMNGAPERRAWMVQPLLLYTGRVRSVAERELVPEITLSSLLARFWSTSPAGRWEEKVTLRPQRWGRARDTCERLQQEVSNDDEQIIEWGRPQFVVISTSIPLILIALIDRQATNK